MPETLGHYALLEEVASSALAKVWLAHDERTSAESRCAVKQFLSIASRDARFVELLLSGVRGAAQLRHHRIQRTLAVEVVPTGTKGVCLVAAEWVAGGNLRQVVLAQEHRGQPLPLRLALQMLVACAEALAYAHAALGGDASGLVHGHLTPWNVLVTERGDVKLADFGQASAKFYLASTEAGAFAMSRQAAYFSPEQASGRTVDRRTDLFSVGTIGFELCTGRELFKRSTPFESVKAVLAHEVPAPSQVNSNIPAALDAVLSRALAADPEARYQSAAELAAALTEVMARLPPELSVPASPLRGVFPVEQLDPPAPEAAPAKEDPLRAQARRGPLRDPRRPPPVGRSANAIPDSEGDSALPTAEEPPAPKPPASRAVEMAPSDRPRRRWLSPLIRTSLAAGLIAWGIAVLPSLRSAFEKTLGPSLGRGFGGDRANGRLTLDSNIPAMVTLGDKALGYTPLVELSLPAGLHRLRLTNDSAAVDREIEVRIDADQTTVRQETFGEGTVSLSLPPGRTYRILYRGQEIGRWPGPPLELSEGTHELTVIEVATGRREQRTVTVAAKAR